MRLIKKKSTTMEKECERANRKRIKYVEEEEKPLLPFAVMFLQQQSERIKKKCRNISIKNIYVHNNTMRQLRIFFSKFVVRRSKKLKN